MNKNFQTLLLPMLMMFSLNAHSQIERRTEVIPFSILQDVESADLPVSLKFSSDLNYVLEKDGISENTYKLKFEMLREVLRPATCALRATVKTGSVRFIELITKDGWQANRIVSTNFIWNRTLDQWTQIVTISFSNSNVPINSPAENFHLDCRRTYEYTNGKIDYSSIISILRDSGVEIDFNKPAKTRDFEVFKL